MPESTLLNLYGSSEVSADVTCYSISPQDKTPARVPIGRPIANTQIHVLDKYLQPVPIGVPGELYISGAGLARGYLNQPEMTADRFISNLFIDFGNPKFSTHLYKTGDLVRYLSDRNLEFLGRIDQQVKLRGFRIELGEIQAVLNQHPGVRETIVVPRENEPSQPQLVAYVVSHPQQTITVTELQRLLKEKLPDYMVPSAFVMLEALPLLPNGKVNYQALPIPDQARPELESVYQPPQTEIEQTIANIWQEVLHVDELGIHDNFFELGGHSLLLVQVHSKIQQTFQRDFSLVEMFQYPTISHLAKYLTQDSIEQTSLQNSQRTESRTASIQRRKQIRQQSRSTTQQKDI
jgi:acyl carrier protein